jgi:F-type H+-transporting ATPase subunit b
MGIDWITVSAQIVNFLVLVWLLKRFLYQPVIRAMDRREQRIVEQLNEAQVREQKADETVKQYQVKTKLLERECDEILAKTHNQAAQKKKQLIDEARKEVAGIREHWLRQAQQEKEEFLGNLRYQVANSIQNIAHTALKELGDVTLEQQIIHSFVAQLATLDQESRALLFKESEDTSEPVRVTSTFVLDAETRNRIELAIHEHLIKGVEIEYEQSPELLCGIAVTVGAGQLGWNLADYLNQLSQHVEDAFAPAASVASMEKTGK